ncbi:MULTISPECIES: DUF1995 family protein [Aphanizomenon]|jgi:hypothetical protein|uniref:DUF1995 family protein n=1 Tax=Aphanizomenon flos-aquae FACHB-1249 TaxID=2692889 RepID=A0ABR8IN20_APHFL|nr:MULTISPECIES: DUF1995 family protein [Aphanizomenon]MBD2389482.1 DUF1995 family protein [Aphanizomenon flos-aquae FACHB-1171]MBD2555658.1 DUF1995 family protein [Aphanizomenon flos-aquae FACHB-1290]MBD2630465.1 DUF1995 family protein [Aphanizomenon sp. FACHB-1399]MBD2641257.1 DUF1995 family protein [Aphanizomenon sp. FACHB-1401]MBD2655657.1 DUF1995 family protein [Aphanizomenon flos-aquae FACHB-1265]
MAELPKTLEDAIAQSTEAVKSALADGVTRIQVELLFPELKFMTVAEQFLPQFTEYESRLKVFFADAGAAALARRDWKDAGFQISDIGTGRAASLAAKIQPEDEIFLFIAPTSVEVPQLEKLCELIGERPVIMLTPRLEDSSIVGIGYTARETRRRFISTIESCYYIRPLDDQSALFRCYPGLWEIWLETEGGYQKITELPKKPSGDELDAILLGKGENTTDSTPAKKSSVFKSLQRFIKALSS